MTHFLFIHAGMVQSPKHKPSRVWVGMDKSELFNVVTLGQCNLIKYKLLTELKLDHPYLLLTLLNNIWHN